MTTTLLHRLSRVLLALIPARSELVYRIARRIVNRYDGDNAGDMRSNGEERLARLVLPMAHVVFDVGANVGEWTASALDINRGAAFHCFEPSAVTFSRLSARQFPAAVTLNNFGFGAEAAEHELYVFDDGCGANSLYHRVGTDTSQLARERVRIETVDGYCASRGIEYVDVMKLDVEGHEVAALRGARRMLAEGRIGLIQFEYGGTYIDARVLLKDVFALVDEANAGYAIYKVHPDLLRPVPRYDQRLETFQYSNWVIARGAYENAIA